MRYEDYIIVDEFSKIRVKVALVIFETSRKVSVFFFFLLLFQSCCIPRNFRVTINL